MTTDPGLDEPNYPNDHEISAAYQSTDGPTVFHSRIGIPEEAVTFAASIGGIFLKDAFPLGYIGYTGRGKKRVGNFIDRTSGILADKASGEVFFVGKWNLDVNLCRV